MFGPSVRFTFRQHLSYHSITPCSVSPSRKHENHRRLALHLLDVIKILRVGLVRWYRFFLLPLRRPARWSDLLFNFVQRRTDKFAVDSFHGMPSFDEDYDWPSLLASAGRFVVGFFRLDP